MNKFSIFSRRMLLLALVVFLGLFPLQNAHSSVDAYPPMEVFSSGNVFLGDQYGGVVLAIATVGNKIILGIGPRLVLMDASNPQNPPVTAKSSVLPDLVYDIEINGDVAFIANGVGGLQIFDVSDPWHITEIGKLDTPGSAVDIELSGSQAYIADSGSGVRIIDISNIALPSEIGFYDTYDYYPTARGVTIVGSYVYVTAQTATVLNGPAGKIYSGSFDILDISTPSAPVKVSSYTLSGDNMFPNGMVVRGNLGYVAAAKGNLRVLHLSIPTLPTEIGSYSISDCTNPIEGMYLSGEYLYLAAGYCGMAVLKLDNPSSPDDTAELELVGWGQDITVLGEYAFLAYEQLGMRILSVSDPSSPAEIGVVHTMGSPQKVFIQNGYAYVGEITRPYYSTGGSYVSVPDYTPLHIFDADQPLSRAEIGIYKRPFG